MYDLKENEVETLSEFYTQEQLALCRQNKVPTHLAFIPDGNRRWAKQHNLSIIQGYQAGADNLIKTVKAAKDLGVQTVTFYTLSTENWARDPLEIRAFLWLLESYLSKESPHMIENGMRFRTIGDLSRFPKSVYNTIQATKEATEKCQEIDIVFALNYGSRDEMRRVIQSILKDYDQQKITANHITEDLISSYMDTALWPDPDLIIRTSGEQRLSNFLLWQSSYAEFVIENIFWPDFTSQHLYQAIMQFQKRERRLGKA